MSINVTVNGGNPISIRRGKMVLSDLENIKRIDRERRKKLRLEQVQEQSRILSKRLLERAKRIKQEELDRLEKDGNTEMRRAHDKKLMEIHRRYQDIESIGYAHENAANQPDIESIRRAEEERNKAMAKARAAEAAYRLQEQNKVISSKSKHQERLNQVRDLENERSRMVAQLSKKSSVENDELTENGNTDELPASTSTSTTRKKVKCVVSKKTPIKKLSRSKIHHSKTPSRISVTINNEDMGSSSRKSSKNRSKKSTPRKLSNVPKIVSDIVEEGNVYVSDDNEPRRSVPVISRVCNKPDEIVSRTENCELSSSSELNSDSSCSASSNDSSYYSDTVSKKTAIRVTPRHHTSPITSKVDMYDHNTRQRNSYKMPSGLVERMNIQNEPNAEDLAQEIIELEKKDSKAIMNQKKRARQRSQDAILRERIKRDYLDLLNKLKELNTLDLKLQANQTSSQQVIAPSKTRKDNCKRQKKMDRTIQTILRNSKEQSLDDRPIERPITITPRDYVHSGATSTWKEPSFANGRESDDSNSESGDAYQHKKELIDLLMKIENSKKKLLQEYGHVLSDEVFNTVVKSIDKTDVPVCETRTECCNVLKPKTPEIQVINMSNCGENNKSTQKITCKTKKPYNKTPAKTISKPSTKNVSTCDQQVQVELEEVKPKEKEEEVISHPIEPVVKIITPQNVDSSTSLSSNSSVTTDVVIDVDQNQITFLKQGESSVKIAKETSTSSIKTMNNTPVKISFEKKNGGKSLSVSGLVINKNEIKLLSKKEKSPENSSKKLSPIVSGLCNSLPESRKSSPAKKLSKSAPPSRHSSPKKSPSRTRAWPSHREQSYRTQYTQVSIDSSTESSQLNSTSETGNGRVYTRFQAMAAQRLVTKLADSSDTSTTYASPPAAAACAMLNAMNSSTPILELLDSSSANETIKQKARQVSPVSSPETPSPRTMKLPSNIPRAERVSRNLRFASLTEAQTSRPATSKSTRSTSYALSLDRQTSSAKTQTTTPTTRHCTCTNPTCEMLHEQIQRTQTFPLTRYPDALDLKTYEDLENVHAERIASLTDLIELLRNEQRGLELSVLAQETAKLTNRSDSTSQRSSGSLTKNIEAIQAQLKKTLLETQQIIASKGIDLSKSVERSRTRQKSPYTSVDLSKETAVSESPEDEGKDAPKIKTVDKPKIVNDERVSLSLSRFQQSRSSKREPASSDQKKKLTATAATSTTPDQDENMVEMLSKEILEQSKSLNKSPSVDSFKNSDTSLLKQSQTAVKDTGSSSKMTVANDELSQSVSLDTSDSNFVPLLAGIPKIVRSKSSGNGRARPPVTLINKPYRPEIISPIHELSTIVEFDTPDTANKSQVSTRSPSNKARKKLPTDGSLPFSSSSPTKRMDVNISADEPSLHATPLASHESPQLSYNYPKKSLGKSPRKSAEKLPKTSFEKPSKMSAERSPVSLEKKRTELEKNLSSDSMQSLPDLRIEHMQQSQDNADGNYDLRISQISELSLPDENIEQLLISELCEESKSKSITPLQKQSPAQEPKQEQEQLTLTSVASASKLSGVSEMSSSPLSDPQPNNNRSSSDEMDIVVKKLGYWAINTLKKTREASALSSSSSLDVTPVNTGTKISNSIKKLPEGTTSRELPAEISDVSSISIKNANKSTERSVLDKGRTSTPNRQLLANNNNNNSNNSDGTISTISSFTSDLNIVVQNQSADISVPNISFSNNNLG